jgi:rhamnosyltransferase
VSGSANSWLDPDLLSGALALAAESAKGLEVDITGGSIAGYDEVTYARLRSLIAHGKPPSTSLHGWLSEPDYSRVLAEATFGIVPEVVCLERRLGSANRCLEWIAAGIPFTISAQSEMARELAAVDAVEIHRAGDPEDLARAIVRLATDPERRRGLADRALAYAQAHWTPEVACAPLIEWLQDPRCLPRSRSSVVEVPSPPAAPPIPLGPEEQWVPFRVEAKRLILRAWRGAQSRVGALPGRVATRVRRTGSDVARAVMAHGGAAAAALGQAGRQVATMSTLAGFAVRQTLQALLPRREKRLDMPTSGPRPRIALVSPYPLLPATAGGTVRVKALIEELARSADLLVITMTPGRAYPAQAIALAPSIEQRFVAHASGSTAGDDLDPPAVRPLRSPELRLAIRDAVAEFCADLVQLEFTELGQFLDAVPAGVPAVLTELDLGFVTAKRRRSLGFHTRYAGDRRLWSSRWDWLRLWRFEVQSANRAAQVHVMSPHDASVLRRQVRRPGDVLSIPNGVALPAVPSTRRDPDLVLFVGFFGHSPNRDGIDWFLSEVWPTIHVERPTAKLAIVGGMPPEHLARRSGVDGIEVLGQVASVRPWLDTCGAFIVPIRAGSGTRIKLLEALAHAAPCVSTSIGAEGIAAVDHEHLLIADAPDAFAAAVCKLLDDSAFSRQLGQAGRQLVAERYTWKASAEVALAGYRELMARYPTPPRPTASVDPPPTGSEPRISVVIPTFRGGPRLLDVLDAVFAQVGTPTFEVVCVDSGSPAEEVAAMRARGARVASIPNEAFDHGLTRDLGAKVGRGEVLVFLNQDAMPCNRYWLSLLTEPLLRPGRHDAIQGGIVEIPERAGRFFWDSGGDRFYYTRETSSWMADYSGLGFSTVNCAIRRSAWEAIHFGWAPIMEDKKWQARATRQGRSIGQRHQAAVAHSHDWTSGGLWRRCRAEGEGWALLDRPYTFGDMIHDLRHAPTWRTWAAALRHRQLRSRAEVLFPLIRPLALWRGSRRIVNPDSPHRPRIRYAPAIVESTT